MSDGRRGVHNSKQTSKNEAVGDHQSCLLGTSDLPPIVKRMSKQRYIDTKFWDDSYVIELTPTEKLLFLYFLTTPLSNIAGIYELSSRRICFDTGIGIEAIKSILHKFQNDRKIYHIDGWIVVCNFPRFQKYDSSPKIREGIDIILKSLPSSVKEKIDTLLIPYAYPSNYPNPDPNINTNRDRDSKRFTPPTLDDVIKYCKERGNTVNTVKWHNHYTANGWKRGKTSIKDWRAAVRTWEPEGFKPQPKKKIESPEESPRPDVSEADRKKVRGLVKDLAEKVGSK